MPTAGSVLALAVVGRGMLLGDSSWLESRMLYIMLCLVSALTRTRALTGKCFGTMAHRELCLSAPLPLCF
jgi:hypothetical protein